MGRARAHATEAIAEVAGLGARLCGSGSDEDAGDDELLKAQEGKGYGEDEGEREQALEEE